MLRLAPLALSAALCAASSLGTAPAASAADYHGGAVADGTVCGEDWVLARISRNFDHQVRNVPHLPDVEIVEFRGPHMRRFHPAVQESEVERTYCGATVQLSDGHSRAVWYFIEEGMGFAGVGANVEACIDGFDRWNVYDGRCRVAR
jgi:capsid protein